MRNGLKGKRCSLRIARPKVDKRVHKHPVAERCLWPARETKPISVPDGFDQTKFRERRLREFSSPNLPDAVSAAYIRIKHDNIISDRRAGCPRPSALFGETIEPPYQVFAIEGDGGKMIKSPKPRRFFRLSTDLSESATACRMLHIRIETFAAENFLSKNGGADGCAGLRNNASGVRPMAHGRDHVSAHANRAMASSLKTMARLFDLLSAAATASNAFFSHPWRKREGLMPGELWTIVFVVERPSCHCARLRSPSRSTISIKRCYGQPTAGGYLRKSPSLNFELAPAVGPYLLVDA